MTRIFSALLLCTCIAAGTIALGYNHAEAATSAGEVVTLSITNPRPIRMAVDKLSQNYGYAITYEDPVYSYKGDLEDVTDQVSRQAVKPGQARIMGLRSGTVSVDYELAADGKPRDILEVVGKLLQTDAKRIGSRLTFFQDGEFIHVVPTRTRNEIGQWVASESLLDSRITIPAEERSVENFFEAVCQALSKAVGASVKSGTVPLNAFIKSKTSQGADNEVARDVVVKMLSTFKPYKLTWSLNYDPSLRFYAFNVTFIVDSVGTIQKPSPVLPPSRNDNLTPMGPRTN